MAIRTIAVIGATGMLGRPVAEQLLQAGYRVTCIARDTGRAAAALPGAATARGDVFDRASLHAAFAGHDAIYVNLNVPQTATARDPLPEREGLAHVLAAARSSGVRRIGFISSLVMNYQGMDGFDWWVFRMKHDAVAAIKASGVPYTIFYPSTFMENFRFTQRRGNTILTAGRSRQPMWYIAGEDYGRQVARAFASETSVNADYPVQGLEAFTADEAAAVYAGNAPARLRRAHAPLAALKLGSLVVPSLRYGWRIIHALNEYPEAFAAQPTWQELGRPTVTLAEYARRWG